MKIVSLNLWGGRAGLPLLDFIKNHSDIDVFLFQEVHSNATSKTVWDERCRANMFTEVSGLLPEHTGFYAPSVFNEWGLAAFVKKSIAVESIGDLFIYGHMESLKENEPLSIGRNLQWLKTKHDGSDLAILNFHGIWTGQGKEDTEDRLDQSRKIIEFIKTLSGNVVLCGDFNLIPATESLEMFRRELGLKDLIAEYDIQSTRTSFYTKPVKFADYVFVSSRINVKDFKVLPDEVSDHSPLFLEI